MPYTHLTENERYVISHLTCVGLTLREIALRINRHHTTISRELKRNDDPVYEDTVYWYDWTHPEALKRRHKARHQRRRSNQRLVNYVKRKLRDDWSPEIIAEKLKIDYPDNDKMRVSHTWDWGQPLTACCPNLFFITAIPKETYFESMLLNINKTTIKAININ